MNGRMDVLSRLKSSSGCLQQSSGAKMGCEWNVWTACKREGCTEHALSQHPRLAEQSTSLPVVTVEPCAAVTASRYLLQMRSQMEQVEVSECITLHLHSSHSPTARVSFLILFTSFPQDIDPLSVPSAQLSSHLTRLPLGLISPEWNDILAQQLVNVEGVSNLRRVTARETVTYIMRQSLLQQTSIFFSWLICSGFCLEYKINHIHYNVPELKKTSSNPCTIDTIPVNTDSCLMLTMHLANNMQLNCFECTVGSSGIAMRQTNKSSVHSNNIKSLKCLMARYKCDTAVTPPKRVLMLFLL